MFCRWRWTQIWFDLKKLEVKKLEEMFLFEWRFCQISLISKKFTQILKINKKFAYTSTAARSSMSMFCRWRWPRFWFDLKKLEVKKWGWPTKCFFWPMKANHTALATGADLADFLTGHQGWPQFDFCWSCCDFTKFFDHAAISRDFFFEHIWIWWVDLMKNHFFFFLEALFVTFIVVCQALHLN